MSRRGQGRRHGSSGEAKTLRLALYQPDIPQNAGTLMRMGACLGIGLDIVEPAGFDVSDRHLRRAGMDYLAGLDFRRHVDFAAFETWRRKAGGRLVLATTRAERAYTDFAFAEDDILMVGRESAGVSDLVHQAADMRLVVPICAGMRSLNVAVAAAMMVGEALRQIGFRPSGPAQITPTS